MTNFIEELNLQHIYYRSLSKDPAFDERSISYIGTYDIDNKALALEEIKKIKSLLKQINKILNYDRVGMSVRQRGRRGENNPHPIFKDNPKAYGHRDGFCPIQYAQRVDVYIQRFKNHYGKKRADIEFHNRQIDKKKSQLMAEGDAKINMIGRLEMDLDSIASKLESLKNEVRYF